MSATNPAGGLSLGGMSQEGHRLFGGICTKVAGKGHGLSWCQLTNAKTLAAELDKDHPDMEAVVAAAEALGLDPGALEEEVGLVQSD